MGCLRVSLSEIADTTIIVMENELNATHIAETCFVIRTSSRTKVIAHHFIEIHCCSKVWGQIYLLHFCIIFFG